MLEVASRSMAGGHIKISQVESGEYLIHDYEAVDHDAAVSLFLWARKVCKGKTVVVTVEMENTKMKQVVSAAGLNPQQVIYRGVL